MNLTVKSIFISVGISALILRPLIRSRLDFHLFQTNQDLSKVSNQAVRPRLAIMLAQVVLACALLIVVMAESPYTESTFGLRTDKQNRSNSEAPSLTSKVVSLSVLNSVRNKIADQVPKLCVSCLQKCTVCPAECCIPNWLPCGACSPPCCNGWRCTNWKWGKRCEPVYS